MFGRFANEFYTQYSYIYLYSCIVISIKFLLISSLINWQNGYREVLPQLLLWENIWVFLLVSKMTIRLFLSKLKLSHKYLSSPFCKWVYSSPPHLFLRSKNSCVSDIKTKKGYRQPPSHRTKGTMKSSLLQFLGPNKKWGGSSRLSRLLRNWNGKQTLNSLMLWSDLVIAPILWWFYLKNIRYCALRLQSCRFPELGMQTCHLMTPRGSPSMSSNHLLHTENCK